MAQRRCCFWYFKKRIFNQPTARATYWGNAAKDDVSRFAKSNRIESNESRGV